MDTSKCKNCGYPVGDCDNQRCKSAHVQGFCGAGCRDTYFAIREYELKRADEKFEHERRRIA